MLCPLIYVQPQRPTVSTVRLAAHRYSPCQRNTPVFPKRSQQLQAVSMTTNTSWSLYPGVPRETLRANRVVSARFNDVLEHGPLPQAPVSTGPMGLAGVLSPTGTSGPAITSTHPVTPQPPSRLPGSGLMLTAESLGDDPSTRKVNDSRRQLNKST